jgi:hypothetical protein
MTKSLYRLIARLPNAILRSTIWRNATAFLPFKKLTSSMSLPTTRTEFTARYLVESSVPSDRAAEVIAGEQSSGTFMALPGETEELKERSRARVVRVDPLPPVQEPTLPSALVARRRVSPGAYRDRVSGCQRRRQFAQLTGDDRRQFV